MSDIVTATINETTDVIEVTISNEVGPANTLSIGTVSTGAAGSDAGATITGDAPDQTLSLTIPRGDKGETGTKGDTGSTGAKGDKGDQGEPGSGGGGGDSSDKLPLAGGTMDDGADIIFHNGSKLREGTTNAGLGGNKGIAQVCSIDYELKWEAGRLYVMGQDGFTIRVEQYGFSSVPTATDDSTKGYVVGSRRILDNGDAYACTDSTTDAAVWSLANSSVQTFGITVDGGGAVLTTGSKGFVTVPYDCTILNWYLAADQAGDVVIDVKRSGASIVGQGNAPTLTSAQSNNEAASAWASIAITAGDILEFVVTGTPTTLTRVNLVIKAS